MNETLVKKNLEKKTVWGGLTEYGLDGDDILSLVKFDAKGTHKIAKKMKVNNYFVAQTMSAQNKDTIYFQTYIDELKGEGMDIGKGEAEYGYKMPLAEKGESRRELIIFRRRIAENE